jgi:hypothetical protein
VNGKPHGRPFDVLRCSHERTAAGGDVATPALQKGFRQKRSDGRKGM